MFHLPTKLPLGSSGAVFRLDELRQFGAEFGEDFYEAISLNATLGCHDVIGGTARHRVKAALEETQKRVESLIECYGAVSFGGAEVAHAGA